MLKKRNHKCKTICNTSGFYLIVGTIGRIIFKMKINIRRVRLNVSLENRCKGCTLYRENFLFLVRCELDES